MCSIEEAWAGQLFENRRVQSQADLHRKYMPITDNLLERNNEFSVGRNEPQSREGTRGMNTQQIPQRNYPGANLQVNFENNMQPMSYYGGLNPRPSYMSIYDNASESGLPMPLMSTIGGKDNFNDINQAFTVSKTVDRFMNQANTDAQNNAVQNNALDNIQDVNMLLNEDNDMDKQVLQKKFQNQNNPEQFNNNMISSNQMLDFQKTLQDILQRLARLEAKMQHQQTRNMYDMVLYILLGMLISFILYAILRK